LNAIALKPHQRPMTLGEMLAPPSTIHTRAGMSPAQCVIDTFGGVRAAARAADVNASTVCRWLQPRKRGGTGGLVPTVHHATLLEKARAMRRILTAEHLVRGKPGIVRVIVHRL
jgi:hypothetical protein